MITASYTSPSCELLVFGRVHWGGNVKIVFGTHLRKKCISLRKTKATMTWIQCCILVQYNAAAKMRSFRDNGATLFDCADVLFQINATSAQCCVAVKHPWRVARMSLFCDTQSPVSPRLLMLHFCEASVTSYDVTSCDVITSYKILRSQPKYQKSIHCYLVIRKSLFIQLLSTFKRCFSLIMRDITEICHSSLFQKSNFSKYI